jgi:hypothetical protein
MVGFAIGVGIRPRRQGLWRGRDAVLYCTYIPYYVKTSKKTGISFVFWSIGKAENAVIINNPSISLAIIDDTFVQWRTAIQAQSQQILLPYNHSRATIWTHPAIGTSDFSQDENVLRNSS